MTNYNKKIYNLHYKNIKISHFSKINQPCHRNEHSMKVVIKKLQVVDPLEINIVWAYNKKI